MGSTLDVQEGAALDADRQSLPANHDTDLFPWSSLLSGMWPRPDHFFYQEVYPWTRVVETGRINRQ